MLSHLLRIVNGQHLHPCARGDGDRVQAARWKHHHCWQQANRRPEVSGIHDTFQSIIKCGVDICEDLVDHRGLLSLQAPWLNRFDKQIFLRTASWGRRMMRVW